MSEKTKKPSDDKFARGMRTATVADIPLLVSMMQRFHKAKDPRFDFHAPSAAAFIEGIMISGVVFMTDAGFIAGVKAPAATNAAYITAHEIGWWAEDRSGWKLREAFEEWASDCDAIEFSHPENEKTVGAMLDRAGYVPATTVWRKICA